MRKRKKADPGATQVTKTSVQLPNRLNAIQQKTKAEPPVQSAYDDFQDNDLYEKKS